MIRWIKGSTEALYQEVTADQLTVLNPELGAGFLLNMEGRC